MALVPEDIVVHVTGLMKIAAKHGLVLLHPDGSPLTLPLKVARKCPGCGQDFELTKWNKKFCSLECYRKGTDRRMYFKERYTRKKRNAN